MGGETTRRCEWGDDRGSLLPLLAVVLGTIALALAVLTVGAGQRTQLARAQWAADGAARAAAAEVVAGDSDRARRVAAAVAEANGARLVALSVRPAGRPSGSPGDRALPVSPTVVVEVEIGSSHAVAAAGRFAVARG